MLPQNHYIDFSANTKKEDKAKSRKRQTIAIAVIAVIVILVATMAILGGHNVRIPQNPSDTMGNTSGNLNNKGVFCESNGKIYFANSDDNFYLYSMDPTTLIAKRIVDVPVSYINAAGDYIYFYYDDRGETKFMGVSGNMRGVYRISKTGKGDMTCLDRTTSGIVSLLGNKLYYQHYDNTDGMTLYSVSLNGKDRKQEVKAIVNPACIFLEDIYYPDQDNMFYLNVFRPKSSSVSLYANARAYNPVADSNYIYYQNVDDDYTLYRYDYSTGTATKVTKERVDAYNVYEGVIFFQTNSGKRPRLVRMNADGSDITIIAEGNFTDINCTSSYTFFRAYDEENIYYLTPTFAYGNASVTEFHPFSEE